MAQYDPWNRTLLDYVMPPDAEGEEDVMTTHFLDGNFGVSAKKGTSTLHLYKVDQQNSM